MYEEQSVDNIHVHTDVMVNSVIDACLPYPVGAHSCQVAKIYQSWEHMCPRVSIWETYT